MQARLFGLDAATTMDLTVNGSVALVERLQRARQRVTPDGA